MNRRALKDSIDTLETINERIDSAYGELSASFSDGDQLKEVIWESSPQQIFEMIEAGLEMLDQAMTHTEMLRNFLEEESYEGVDIDRDFDDNAPNTCDRCQRRMNRKGNRR